MSKLIPQNQLMVLFQERPFREEADIYAIDKKGELYIFELKRWQASHENILQVLRYGQIYGQYSYEQLEAMLRKYAKTADLDLAQKHYEYFQEIIPNKLSQLAFNQQQHFIVITNGTDLVTRNAIKYWQDKGLLIDSIIYWVYQVDKQLIFEFDPYNPEREVIIEEEGKYYIVNTNLTWSKTDYRDMLDNQKAAAYDERASGIKNINIGDTVFLYHNGRGVIAFGKVKSKYKSKLHDNNREEGYVELIFDWSINPDTEPDKAIKAWQINKELSSQYAFRQTVFSIRPEMANVIKKLAKEPLEPERNR